jgi:hypothetical protein
MRDTQKVLRKAIYDALNGTVLYDSAVVPVFDEKRSITSTANLYILLSTQTETASDTSDAFMTISTIDIEVCHKTGSEVSKDTMDDVANEVLEILFPTAWSVGINNGSLMQIANLRRDRTVTRVIELSSTESVLRKIITLSATIVEQN